MALGAQVRYLLSSRPNSQAVDQITLACVAVSTVRVPHATLDNEGDLTSEDSAWAGTRLTISTLDNRSLQDLRDNQSMQALC